MAPELDVAADEADHLAEAADAPRPGGPLRRLFATLLDMGIVCGLCALLATPVTESVASLQR